MPSLISQQLEKASIRLKDAIAAHANVNIELQTVKTQFISTTNPVIKEKLKPKLIALTKQERSAKAELDKAEMQFQKILQGESTDVIDLLDHAIKEHYVKMLIRNEVKKCL
jgi:hypothetical protein